MKFPKTILIIDDEREGRLKIKEALMRTAERFFEASNGREGLEFLGKNKIHAVIVDDKMPIMDGIAFMKQVRAKRLEVPCIMLTENASQDPMLKTNAVLWGVFQLLEKTGDLEHLIQVCQKAIELSERISHVDAELDRLCEKNEIPQDQRAVFIKAQRPQLILQLTMEAMSSKPVAKTGS